MRNNKSTAVSNMSMRLPILFACGLMTIQTEAADFKGAVAVLKEAAQQKPKPKEQANDPFSAYREKLKAFKTENTNLPPAKAASQWLEIVDEFDKVQADFLKSLRRGRTGSRPLQFQEVLKSLPSPASWAELEKQVDNRNTTDSKSSQKRNIGLKLMVHTLTANRGKRTEDLKDLEKLSKSGDGPDAGMEFAGIFNALNEAILATMDDPEAILRMLESQLAQSSEFEMALNIPNLVALVGAEKSDAFFRKAFKTSRTVVVEPGTATHKLATKIALEMIGQMPKPQWELVNSLDSVDLYEALDKKFNQAGKEASGAVGDTGFFGVKGSPNPFQVSRPKLYYFLGLISKGRADDAIKTAKGFDKDNRVYFPPEIIKQMERAGLTTQLNEFFAQLLKQNPEAPFWDEYVRIAAHAGHADEALALVRATAQQKDLSRSRRAHLNELLPTALLANDEVETGIAELRRSATNNEVRPSRYNPYSGSQSGQAGIQIARIGQLLNRKDWVEEGISMALKKSDENADSESSDWSNPELQLAELLSQLGRGPEAEDVCLKALSQSLVPAAGQSTEFLAYRGLSKAAPILAELLKVYHHAGRYEDVVQLLDTAEDWGSADLGDIQLSRFGMFENYSGHTVETPLSFYAASALAKTGKKSEATIILKQLLEQNSGLDRGYELLLEIDPTNALTRLDELFARDQFEERPLIWKAHLLRSQGKLEAAEQAARKAISIDPSDGEEGPGDRMRAYSELAEIRAARGDLKEAAFFREAVAAIRESESADRLHEAGLLKRAVKMYQDSLTHFSDAYCIQSRLAIQLADMGLHEQAEEHYRKAYELMPESFGRVESHCFGCERAFEGERAQGIAEKVFTQLAEKTPNKPQVHYLLGYLRQEQERPNEAIKHYRQAVKLDPDYLNAWHKISEIGAKAPMAAADRDEVAFNLLRLDPHGHHGGYSFNTVSDLQGLWNRVAQIPGIDQGSKTLYPLAASKRKLETRKDKPVAEQEISDEFEDISFEFPGNRAGMTPAAAVAQNGFIQAAIQLISSSADSMTSF
jgi:tetratricopeptide (TPR) repeat protein